MLCVGGVIIAARGCAKQGGGVAPPKPWLAGPGLSAGWGNNPWAKKGEGGAGAKAGPH